HTCSHTVYFFFLLLLPPPPTPTLFPYTTLSDLACLGCVDADELPGAALSRCAEDAFEERQAMSAPSRVRVDEHLDPRRRRFAGSDRKSTRLTSSPDQNSYAVFCLKKNNRYSHNM